jgi:thymidylate synthase ThyX
MYALCFAFRIRYVMDMNAREAMHLIELRSGRQGHRNYREIAHRMHDEIARLHPAVAAMMVHVDRADGRRLERRESEVRDGPGPGAAGPDALAPAARSLDAHGVPGSDDELMSLFPS